MTQATSTKPDWKLNVYGQMELLVPSTQEYALAVIPMQSQGGLVVRLVPSQFQLFETLEHLPELQSLPAIKREVERLTDLNKVISSLIASTLAQVSNKLTPNTTATVGALTEILQTLDDFRLDAQNYWADAPVSSLITQQFVLTRNLIVDLQTVVGVVRDNTNTTNRTLISTNNGLDVLHQDLVATNNGITAIRQDLVATNNGITAIRQDLVATNNSITAIRQDLAAIAQKIDALSQSITPPLSTTFANVAMPVAQTEYSYPLPAGTKAITIRCNILPPVVANDPPRAVDVFYSFEAGQAVLAARGQNNIDGSLPRCRRILALNSEFKEVRYGNKTLYLACAQAGWIAEIDVEV